MFSDSKIASETISGLEKFIEEINCLRLENIKLLMELEELRFKVLEAKHTRQIESKIYLGIKKYFR